MHDADSTAGAPERDGAPITATETVGLVARGFAMGAADVVPGVSGGTVALVLGIYERLVTNIRTGAAALGRAARLDGRGFLAKLQAIEWRFIIPLLAGIGLAVVSLARLISTALEDHPVPMGAMFLGLVAASAIVAWRMLDRAGPDKVAVLLGAAALTFVVLGIGSGGRTDAAPPLVFAAGALAICAMILPGVSGSFLLLTIGMYELVIDAVDQRDIGFLIVFMAGCVTGLALFSSALSWALEHHRDWVLAGLTGLMVGSLRVLWPWPLGTEETGLAAPGEQWGLALVVGVIAFLFVLVVSEVGQRRAERRALQTV